MVFARSLTRLSRPATAAFSARSALPASHLGAAARVGGVRTFAASTSLQVFYCPHLEEVFFECSSLIHWPPGKSFTSPIRCMSDQSIVTEAPKA